MSVDARGTIEALETARRTFQTISIANGGRVVDTAGDSVLAIFKTAAGATAAALAIQHELETRADADCRRPPSPLSHRAASGRRGAKGRRLRVRRRRQRGRQASERCPGGRDRRIRVDSACGPRQGRRRISRTSGITRSRTSRSPFAPTAWSRRDRARPASGHRCCFALQPASGGSGHSKDARSCSCRRRWWRRRWRSPPISASTGGSRRPMRRRPPISHRHRFPSWSCHSPIRPATRRRRTSPMP